MNCTECQEELNIRNRTGKCRKCYKREYEYSYCIKRYQTDKSFKNKQITKASAYNKIHSKERLSYKKKYTYDRERKDISFKLGNYLRSRLTHIISGNKKKCSAVKDLGCSLAKFKIHLQLGFYRNPRNNKEYMSWNNYGVNGWHIDHIKPLSKFDLTNPEEIKKACHYTNLQPLWWFENIKKGNRYESLRKDEE